MHKQILGNSRAFAENGENEKTTVKMNKARAIAKILGTIKLSKRSHRNRREG